MNFKKKKITLVVEFKKKMNKDIKLFINLVK